MKQTDRAMLSGTLLLTFSGLFGQVVGFFYRIVLSRMIGAELMGLYQLIMPVYAVLSSLTAAGLTVAVSALSARALPDGHATISIVVEVRDKSELEGVINRLNNVQGVYHVGRASGK